ncbi:uncharacterized protein LOC131597331 [Vicia villosa]|uniref:uncharacterized protein LOC131597331 n=1 Tax=Vicia villosa TaxID=3911 RepID=UPI00273A7B12|nr:uncharacterized protein LOC131597331 [Vicia villosa]
MEAIERSLCIWLWGSIECDFMFKPSEGRSGGILTIWDNNVLSVKRRIIRDHVLCVEGEWGTEKKPVNIVNVYAPCVASRKHVLWNELKTLVWTKSEDRWCIAGDFNTVRNESERRGSNTNLRNNKIENFDKFITEAKLIDLPLHGRRFTWSRPGGSSRSRIDRFLISEAWIRDWSASYHNFVKEQWRELKVEGWGMFVLKEKLKQIKERLKEWHKNHSQNLGEKIKATKSELNRLEVKEESMGLADEEINSKRETSASLYNLSKLECSIQWQKSRSKWVKEGDANTKYFHGCVKKRRRENEILALEVNGNMLKGAGE